MSAPELLLCLAHADTCCCQLSKRRMIMQAHGKFFYLDADHFEDKALLDALTPSEPSAAPPSDRQIR